MARTTKRGTCELCGASANVGMNHGAKVCPQCTHVQSALNKRIESVAAAARSMGKTEELLGHLIPAGGGIAVKMTADFLQEISGIVGYDGEDPEELVAAVRRRVLTCASCEAEDVLAEIREIVGYVPEQGDKGLAEAVRAFADRRPAEIEREDDCTALREDLDRSTRVIEELRAKLQEALDANDSLVGEGSRWKDMVGIGNQQLEKLRAELTLAQQARDEWEQRAVHAEANVETMEAEANVETMEAEANVETMEAEANVETMEAELKEAETRNGKLQYQLAGYAPEPCASTTYLLDIALKALRGEGPDADQLATLIDAARRAA